MRMEDDALDAGVRALRVATAAPADGEATRARVLGLVEQGRVRRARVRRFGVAGLAVVATLSMGSAAWTALGHFRARLQTPAPRARPLALATPGARGPVAPPTEAARAVAPPAALAAKTRPLAVSPAATPDVESALYARAHEAHFTHDDPARALTAWNRYLAAYPRGAFAPDARYNRALCMLRLGWRAAAAEALRPFAEGAYQGYRQLEAQSLLDWMARQAPSQQ
jgi:TolA-binding protein